MDERDGYLEFTTQARLLPPPDVLVAGGGIAGCMAAIAAARAGVQVLLVEAYGFLGGIPVFNAGQHMCFCGDSANQGEVFDELMDTMEELGATVPYQPWNPYGILDFTHEDWDLSIARYFDTAIYQLVLQEMVTGESNIRILLHTRVVDVVAQNGVVGSVLIHNASGLQAIQPRVVIDCTGDANLAAAGGFPCIEGREGDGAPIPQAMYISLRDTGEPVVPALPPWGVRYRSADDMPMTALTLEQERRADFREKVAGYDPTDGESLTQAELHSRRNVLSIVHYLQTHGYPTWKLDSVSTQVGTRIGRRIAGEYTLTADDLRRGARFDDGIARGTCNLSDKSLMDGSSDKQTHADLAVEVVPAYQIPYRSLVPKGSRNLLAAGRCMSADSWALSSARMMPACSMMGQAAGVAAAWCAKGETSVMDVAIPILQEVLRAKGAEF